MNETPQDGTPAFDDLDAAFDDKKTIPMNRMRPPGRTPIEEDDSGIGPAPDHASEYVPPRPLPPTTDHRTIENIPIKISAAIDPRRFPTQKAIHVLHREQAAATLAVMREAQARQAEQARAQAAADRDRSGSAGIVIALGIALAVVVTLGFVVFRLAFPAAAPAVTLEPPNTPTPLPTAREPIPTAQVVQPATPKPEAPAAVTAAPEPEALPSATKPPRKPKPKNGEPGPAPINE